MGGDVVEAMWWKGCDWRDVVEGVWLEEKG